MVGEKLCKNPGRFGFGGVVGEKTAQSRFGEEIQCFLRVGLRAAAAAALHARALGALGVRLGCGSGWARGWRGGGAGLALARPTRGGERLARELGWDCAR